MLLSKTSEIFIEEMGSKVKNDYEEFCSYQRKMVETLHFFHEICMKYDITYYLAYGSLIGALRDEGQIPWDYDIDVWVPFSQAKKLMSALDENIADKYHYITRFKQSNYRTYTLKLAPKEYDCEVLHVDVFWLTGAYDDNKKNEEIHKLKTLYHNLSLIKYCPKKYLGVSGMLPNIIHTLRRIKYMNYNKKKMDGMFNRIMEVPCESSSLWTDNVEVKELRKEWFGKPKLIKVRSSYEFCIPEESEIILTTLYGDYMSTPSLDARVKEFYGSLNRIRNLGMNREG